MRCPKCGYISFDHIDDCLKCGKDVSKVSNSLEGTTYNVAAPSFLKFTPSNNEQKEEERSEISFDADEYDVVDPDLDVLSDDDNEEGSDDATISFGDELDGFDDLGDDDTLDLGSDDSFNLDDEDDELDLGQLEDSFDMQEEPGDGELDLAMPDELSDISDLSAPAEAVPQESKASDPQPMPEDLPDVEKEEVGDFNLDLDLEELSEEFSLTEGEEESEKVDVGDISMDDLGLSDQDDAPLEGEETGEGMDMDADLDFDLDLGGLTLKDEE